MGLKPAERQTDRQMDIQTDLKQCIPPPTKEYGTEQPNGFVNIKPTELVFFFFSKMLNFTPVFQIL